MLHGVGCNECSQPFVRLALCCTNNKPPHRGGAVPFPAPERVEMVCQFPEGLILGRFSLGQLFFSFFYPCCPMRGHVWTALLNPIDRPSTSSTFFQTTLLSPSFQPSLLLIFMLLLISGDIHPNPGPIDPCFVCSRRVTWGNRSVQCTNCSLWVHLSCSGLSLADFRKISPGHSWTCPMCPSSSQPPLPLTP